MDSVLVQRGSLTLWFDEKSIESWCEKKRSGKKGRSKLYSDEAILCALMIRAVYNLPLRALRGFLLSIVGLLSLNLPIPCYTRFSRRSKTLGQELKRLSNKKPTDIVTGKAILTRVG